MFRFQQAEALAVSGDLLETNNSSQPPLEEIKLGEIIDNSDPRRCRPELGKNKLNHQKPSKNLKNKKSLAQSNIAILLRNSIKRP